MELDKCAPILGEWTGSSGESDKPRYELIADGAKLIFLYETDY